ncbi:MAG: L-threonylcarbamoyladenylate synthase [bacterium]|nr:L-threonylcarbamoyladenylate synthase [bacterium]
MLFKSFNKEALKIIKTGGIGVIPTDTIYGLVGSALNKKTVERIYKLRKRNLKKPMIILIGNISDLKKFQIPLLSTFYFLFSKYWPGKVSIILPCPSPKFKYLHRGTKSLAFRLPKTYNLKTFLKKTGPLVAPSANLEGKPSSATIKNAGKYFGDRVDFYINAGKKISNPSKVLKLEDNKIKVLRK